MVWLWIPAVVLVVAGLLGLLLPVLPDTPLIFAGLLLGAWADHFHRVGPWTLTFLGFLALLGWGIDLLAGYLGARVAGAHRRALGGAMVGTLVGLWFGLPGLILGPMIGAGLGEASARRGLGQVIKSSLGAGLGFLMALALRIACAFVMIGTFIIAWCLH